MTHKVVGENLIEELKKHYVLKFNYVDSLITLSTIE